jgi:hypothetical protein
MATPVRGVKTMFACSKLGFLNENNYLHCGAMSPELLLQN